MKPLTYLSTLSAVIIFYLFSAATLPWFVDIVHYQNHPSTDAHFFGRPQPEWLSHATHTYTTPLKWLSDNSPLIKSAWIYYEEWLYTHLLNPIPYGGRPIPTANLW